VNGILVNGLHALAATIGVLLIVRAERTSALDRLFWPLVLALCAAIAAVLFRFTEPHAMFEDFRRAYWEAGEAVWHGRDGFERVYARGVDGFVNMPIVAYLFAPFGLLSARRAAIAFFALGVLALLIAWRLLTRLFALDKRDSALCLFALSAFGPALYSLREGNISHVMLPLLLYAVLALRRGQEARTGALIAVATLLKPPLALVGLYLFLRGRWRAVLAGAGTGAGLLLLSVLAFGVEMHLLWYRACIVAYSSGTVPGFNVQSVAAFVARFELGHTSYQDWSGHALSARAQLASLALTAALAGAALLAMLRRGWRAPRDVGIIELEIWIVVLLACMLPTLSWSHYYVWALPALVLAWRALQKEEGARAWRLAALAAFVLIAPVEFYSAQMRAGVYGPLSNALTSHALIGGMVLLLVLLRLRWHADACGGATPDAPRSG
jgi:alpha-1,2-mannosyltransferase